jgi:hypothetical protein
MAVRLSALHAGHPLSSGRYLRAIVHLEVLGKLKNPVTLLGIEPVTFQLVA